SNGWDPNEMFRFNEENYGVKSTYDSSLAAYTVPLARDDSAAFRQRLARAAALAREIEASPGHRLRAALEEEEEEEEEEEQEEEEEEEEGEEPQRGRGRPQATPTEPGGHAQDSGRESPAGGGG
ncbi:PREDICTED: ataxin-2-like protein, partial [Pseudopodoces humilis]|uniref:ataxin-2-like protein n=1 Tax=Pseudopodoces humilis TaxID=181119 RepID=UPI0006B70885